MSLRVILLCLAAAAVYSQSTVCLPTAWQAFETIFTNSPNPQQENVAFMRWRDMTQNAERFDFMMFHDHSQRQAFQILNFANGISYFVEEQAGQPQSCTLMKLPGPMQQECLSANATQRGSGFVGASFAVNFWHEDGIDRVGGPMFIDITLAANTPSPVPIESRHVYFSQNRFEPPFFELKQFWNFQAGTVNSTLFQVPSLCNGQEISDLADSHTDAYRYHHKHHKHSGQDKHGEKHGEERHHRRHHNKHD